MDNCQETLISLLSAAIGSRDSKGLDINPSCWEWVIEYAAAHDVAALLYPAIISLPEECRPGDLLMESIKKSALFTGAKQLQDIEDIKRILVMLKNSNIPVIALKGLILRNLYPQPCFRIMVDADLLVPDAHLNKAKKILLSQGYRIDASNSKDIHFSKYNHLSIELHQSLFNSTRFKNTRHYISKLWADSVKSDIEGLEVLSLSPEDMLLHLIFHMAEHFMTYGFGLRLLCDLTILTKVNFDKYNWTDIFERLRYHDVEYFSTMIFYLCNKLFNSGIPIPDAYLSSEDLFNIDLLLSDIIASGIHGHRTGSRRLGNQLLHYSSETKKSLLGYIITYVFPPLSKLGSRYSYANRLPLLYPAAWIHRLVFNLFNRRISDVSKAALSSPEESLKIVEDRRRLIKWLKLD